MIAFIAAASSCSSGGGVRSGDADEIRDLPKRASGAIARPHVERATAATMGSTQDLIKQHITRETLEAYLVAADEVIHGTAKLTIDDASAEARRNYLMKMARSLREVYELHAKAFSEKADQFDSSMDIQLETATNALRRIESGVTDAMALREIAIFHRSDMQPADAHKLLKRMVDQHVLIQLRKFNEVSAALLDAQQALSDEIDSSL